MSTPIMTRDILLAALAGFQLDKQRIDAKIAEVQAMLDGRGPKEAVQSAAEATPEKGTRKRSAAVRKRMAEAQKARWAKIKGDAQPTSTAVSEAPVAKAKRKMSEAGRKRIIAAAKKRWREAKAVKKAAPKKAVKKAAHTKAEEQQ